MSLALLAALLWPLHASAATMETIRALEPLASLGGRLERQLPGLGAQNLYVPGFTPLTHEAAAELKLPESSVPFPAAWNPLRAAIFVERSREAGLLTSGPESAAPAKPEEARRTLEAVNSVLVDFSPEQLQTMGVERLRDLAAVVMDQIEPREALSEAAVRGTASISHHRAALALGKRTHRPELYSPYSGANDGHELPRYTRDVPDTVRIVDRPGVYRHFMDERRKGVVTKKGTLGNAVLPYIQKTHGVWQDYYETLTGLFLTLPGVPARSVGVRDDNAQFVDLIVPSGFPVLEIEKGRIYLVPLPGKTESWIKDLYRKWVMGDRGALSYYTQLPRVEGDGGIGPRLRVPVAIIK
jgi:hypothetical protein